MELSLTTFVLEIVNFLILIWILKRLFFVPIKRGIEERKASVARTLKDAQNVKNQADQLRLQYEGCLREWESKKEQAQEELGKNLAEERTKRLKHIEVSLESESEKKRALEKKKSIEAKDRLEREALKHALDFISRLLRDLASPELEAKIVKLALEYFHKGEVPHPVGGKNGSYAVRTAFELSEEQKDSIRNAIMTETGKDYAISFSTEKDLVAGVEIVLGSMVVRANLRDELIYFSEAGRS